MKQIFLYVLILLGVSLSSSLQSKNTLVLFDNSDIRTTHSIFFKSLEGKLFGSAVVSVGYLGVRLYFL